MWTNIKDELPDIKNMFFLKSIDMNSGNECIYEYCMIISFQRIILPKEDEGQFELKFQEYTTRDDSSVRHVRILKTIKNCEICWEINNNKLMTFL